MMYFYIDSAGQTCGPVPAEELAALGVVQETPVWCEGMPDWARARTRPELAPYLTPAVPVQPLEATTIPESAATPAETAPAPAAPMPVEECPTVDDTVPPVEANVLNVATSTAENIEEPSASTAASASVAAAAVLADSALADTVTASSSCGLSAVAETPATHSLDNTPSATPAAEVSCSNAPQIALSPSTTPPPLPTASTSSAPLRTATTAVYRVDLMESIDLWKWWNIALVVFSVLAMCFSMTIIAIPLGVMGAVKANDTLKYVEHRTENDLLLALSKVKRWFYIGCVLFVAGLVLQIVMSALLPPISFEQFMLR